MPTHTAFQHGQFCWVDLSSHGMDAAQAFYQAVFGWTISMEDTQGGPPYATIYLNGQSVGGIGELNDEMKAQGIPPTWNSYVNVTDISAAADQAEAMGATIIVPVMDVLDVGRLAFFLDPFGAQIALWEAKTHIGADVTCEPGSFCWNELATRDADGAAEFYKKLFGWTYDPNPHSPTKYHIIKCGESWNGGIMQMTEEWGEMPSHWSVYFAADDIQARCKNVTDAGGKICHGPFETPVGPIAICGDPQGAMFSMIEMRGEEAENAQEE